MKTSYRILYDTRIGFFFCLMMILIFTHFNVSAQNLKTEIRAVWVATVSNLDWPAGNNRFDKDQQQSTMLALLDSVAAWNLNTIFLQIRPQSDAFYESQLAPWSEYVSGTRGTSPGYDPLLFVINEAHKRGLELHGWLNPYRYETFKGKNDGKPGDFNATNPEWMLNYHDDRIFNPGVPEVRQHLKNIVGEIISNYDIDGIHFDDYFYPYSGTSDEDQETYNTYGGAFTDIADWRRNNVNQMIADVYDTIQQIKPFVRFGISPFGIYGNNQNPTGISGLNAYNVIYTDPLQWFSSGNVDYICPQLYWPTGGSQDFAALLPWWAEHAFDNNRHVIAGHGVYRLDNNAPISRAAVSLHEYKRYFDTGNEAARIKADAWTLSQVSLQIDIVRDNRSLNAMGGAFFRYQDFIRVNGLADYLEVVNYSDPALMPSMIWKNQELPASPANIRWEEDDSGVSFITWDDNDPNLRYVIYGSDTESPDQSFFDNPTNIIKVLYGNSYFLDEASENGDKPHLFFSAYDRYGNESSTSTLFSIQAPSEASTLLIPANSAENQPSQFDFSWSSVEQSQSYLIEIASTNDFSEKNFEYTVFANTIEASQFALLGSHQYYWRITPINAFGQGPVSDVFSFKTGFPANPVLISPVDGEELVELLPLIQWSEDILATEAKMQIAKGGDQFEAFNVIIDEDLGAVSEYQVANEFLEWTTYHIRLKLLSDIGESQWSSATFKTLIVQPEAPVIYTPVQNEAQPEGSTVEVKWAKTKNAAGYQIKLSSDIEADVIIEQKEIFSANDTTFVYSDLLPGVYYFNVAGKNVGGNGDWSQVKFEITTVLGTDITNLVPKYLSASYTSSGSILIWLDIKKLQKYDLIMYDLFGRKIDLPVPESIGNNKLMFNLEQSQTSGFGLVVLKSEKGIQYLKFISK